jgi:hypothetical protein
VGVARLVPKATPFVGSSCGRGLARSAGDLACPVLTEYLDAGARPYRARGQACDWRWEIRTLRELADTLTGDPKQQGSFGGTDKISRLRRFLLGHPIVERQDLQACGFRRQRTGGT